MNYKYLYGVVLMMTVSGAQITKAESQPASQTDQGKKLHEGNCVRCHNSQLYLRENRKVKNLGALSGQVQTCTTNLGLTWFEDEVAAVANYLNAQYYKFKETDHPSKVVE